MPDSILSFPGDQPASPAQIGQKAASLQHLARAGFPVPPGIVLTTGVFQQALAPFAQQIQALRRGGDLRTPAVAQGIAQKIAALLVDLHLPLAVRPALTQALAEIGDGPWAVRSSATLEDLPNASFAGQYESVLGVQGEAGLLNAILTCWRSCFSANALTAQAAYATDQEPAMAVLIQPLLNADCSGVCFTVDPIRQRADLLLMTTAWGLGAGVVAGTVPADTTRVRRSDLGLEEMLIADKHTAIQPDPAGGVQAVAVAAEQRQIACLPESWLRRLGQFGLAVEQQLGEPQDIEWAIADQQVWLLQSRPITTLPAAVRRATHFPIDWANDAERTRLWWLDRHTSRTSATLLPAELAFIKTSSLGGQAAVEMGGAPGTRWHKYVNGRVYMARADSPVGPGEQRIRHAAWRDLCDRLHGQGLSLWDYWGPEVIQATQRLSAFDGKAADGPALADFLEDTLAASQRHWMIHTLLPRGGPFEGLLATYAQLLDKPPAAVEDLPFLLQGAETVQTRLIETLYDLACLALENPSIATLLQSKAVDRWTQLAAMTEAASFVAQCAQVLTVYGGRVVMCPAENGGAHTVELALPWREVPEHLLAMIVRYFPSAQTAASPRTARAQAWAEFQTRIETLCHAATDAPLVATFRHHLQAARHQAAFLDEHNHYIDQLSEGQYAQALIDAGCWLAARGDLPHRHDVFWLQPPEILAALRTKERQNFDHTLAERKAQFAEWSALATPAYIGLPDPQLPERPPATAHPGDTVTRAPLLAPNTLNGQAASAGRGSGRARIISEATSLPEIAAGDVLIALNAGPQWTPIFPLLAGIVLEASYLGDHAAITAREFGVPAVFGVATATLAIPPDAWVTVDGETGTVTWE